MHNATAMSAIKALPMNGSSIETVPEEKYLNAISHAEVSAKKSSQLRRALSDRAARRLEIIILTVVVICVMALLSLPSTLHFVGQENVCLACASRLPTK